MRMVRNGPGQCTHFVCCGPFVATIIGRTCLSIAHIPIENPVNTPRVSASPAFRFVLTMGIVNLFADMTYEGGGGINGAFLGSLGASAAAVAIIAGAGEFLGYAMRALAGYFADRSGRYWPLTFVGYVINLLAVPAMALATGWPAAAMLVFAERTGRALRKPPVEAMLSYTTSRYGKGWVYAVNSALDETGATLGPILVAVVLFLGGGFRAAYATLIVSSLLALASLTLARRRFPHPSRLDEELELERSGLDGSGKDSLQQAGSAAVESGAFTLSYWLFMCAASCFAAGLLSYELISFHLTRTHLTTVVGAPLLLAFATGGGVLANLALGRTYDLFGLPVVLIAVVLSALCAPLVFLGGLAPLILAMPLLGIGYAVQDTLLKAIVVGVMPPARRSLAFGLFYTGYGCGWLAGSVVMGLLYERSLGELVSFALLVQLASVPLFVLAARRMPHAARAPGSDAAAAARAPSSR
jgi:MFS family permease